MCEGLKGDEREESEQEEYQELLKFTIGGFLGGLFLGIGLDSLGLKTNVFGQWAVRTFSGEGESIFEGIYAFRQRLRGAKKTMLEAYGWGKLFGMTVPWFIDGFSRLFGVDMFGVESFYIPYFYAMSDQIGANVSGMLFLRRKHGSWGGAFHTYIHHPVMLTSLLVIFIAPAGLFVARIIGFRPTSQVFTAVETIGANLCWLPPVVGLLFVKGDEHGQS